MREILAEIVRQTSPLFEKIRVTGLDIGVKVEAHTEDKNMFLVAELNEPVREFAGEFGMSNLSLVNGLLNFPSYKGEKAKFKAKRTERDGVDYLSEFEFYDAHGGCSRYRTMNPRLVGDQAKIQAIPWEVSVVPQKAKITEFIQLAGLLSEVEKQFSVNIENKTMFLTIGGGRAATSHSSSIAFASDVTEELPHTNMVFKVPQFLSVLKAAGNLPVTVKFSSRGVAGVIVDTGKGTYSYILRASEG